MLDSLLPGKRIHKIFVFSGTAFLFLLIIFAVILLFRDNQPKPVITEKSESDRAALLKVMDFYLDDELRFFFKREFYPMRDQSSGWTEEEVDKYFIPVDEILYEYFQKKNDNYIKEIFSSVD